MVYNIALIIKLNQVKPGILLIKKPIKIVKIKPKIVLLKSSLKNRIMFKPIVLC